MNMRLVLKIYVFFIVLMLPLSMLQVSYASYDNKNIVVVYRNNVKYYDSISSAVSEAYPNSTIYVGPGIYYEHIIINKPLTIIGIDLPTIDGSHSGSIITIENASYVKIEGLKIINSGRFYSSEDSGIKIKSSKFIWITKNVLRNVFYCILVYNSTWVWIIDNDIESIPEYFVQDRGHGVYAWYSFNLVIEKNIFNYTADGSYNDHAYNIIIKDNIIKHARYGVHLMYCKNITADGNMVTRSIAGIVPMYSSSVIISNNSVFLNKESGVGEGIFLREADDIVIEDNIIVGNIEGFYISYTPYTNTKAIIRRNIIAFNYIGITIDTDSRLTIYDNSFIENIQDVSLYGEGTSQSTWFNATIMRGNFWSTYKSNRPYIMRNALEDMMDGYKQLRIFMYSPAYLLLETMKNSIPTGRIKLIDEYPLQKPSISPNFYNQNFKFQNIIYPLMLTLSAFIIIFYIRREVL